MQPVITRLKLCQWSLFESLTPYELESIEAVSVFWNNNKNYGALVKNSSDEVHVLGKNPFANLDEFHNTKMKRVDELCCQNIVKISIGETVAGALSSDGALFLRFSEARQKNNYFDEIRKQPVALDWTENCSGFGKFEKIEGSTVYSKTVCGAHILAALATNGDVVVFGRNGNGVWRVELNVEESATDIAAGHSHVAILTSQGCVYTWGREDFGQRGIDLSGGSYVMYRVEKMKIQPPCVKIWCGGLSTVCLTSAGEVYACGSVGFLTTKKKCRFTTKKIKKVTQIPTKVHLKNDNKILQDVAVVWPDEKNETCGKWGFPGTATVFALATKQRKIYAWDEWGIIEKSAVGNLQDFFYDRQITPRNGELIQVVITEPPALETRQRKNKYFNKETHTQ